MKQVKKNLSASVYNRLKNVARERKRPVQEIFQYYAMERFLYRLSISHHQNSFFLKGGLMLMVWDPHSHRATVDIDLLAKTSNKIENLKNIIIDICTFDVIPDGIHFETNSLKIREAQLDTEYHGLSASFTAQLFTAKLPMRIDFGFSDSIFPKPTSLQYPVLLDFPKPKLKGYTLQTLIAEKFESIVRLGLANTRMKDFYDIWLLIQQFPLDQKKLIEIVQKVLKKRDTHVSEMPKAFTEEFYNNANKIEKWKGFLKDVSHDEVPLKKVIMELKNHFECLFSKI